MSYSQLIYLFIILGLISYSYEFNVQNNNNNNKIRRRIRDALLKSDTQEILNKILADQRHLEDEIKEAIRKDDDAIRVITRNIMVAADQMAEAGSQHIRSVTEWTIIQGELRKGINLVIEAYRRYIDLHRQVCESIENFAKGIITKYEMELSAIDQMSPPVTTTGIIDTGSEKWTHFMDKFLNMLNYARVHQETLRTATDCTADLMTRALLHQSDIMIPPQAVVPAVTVRIAQPSALQYATQSISLPCNDITEYNGYQTCPNAIADATRSYASLVCGMPL